MEKTGIFKTLRGLSDLGRERTGVAAVEFALVIPFIIVLLLASVDAVFALTAKRKVAVATHSIADLSAREQNLADDTLSAIADLGRLMLTPFDASRSRITITGAEVLGSGNQAVVRWSHLFDAASTATGSVAAVGVALPTGTSTTSTVNEFQDGFVMDLDANLSPGTFLVLSAVELPYNTFFQFLETRFNNGELFTLTDQAYFQSRSGTEITNLDP
ncbi:MAG: TadE/TadG family type IV pilus assembly protein [Hyphomicrobiales bacterium]